MAARRCAARRKRRRFTLCTAAAMHRSAAMSVIYKICPAELWRAAEHDGVFRGASVDLADGFIHFSTAAQVVETAAKHFAGQSDLLLVRVHADRLGDALKWEPSRGGALFPHLYGVLHVGDVHRVEPLPSRTNGTHAFPPLEP
jgi:uncharacterized protein (DUF952 family)